MTPSSNKPLARHLTALGAWALAFGCAVGWDSFVLPWTTFLPKAGPLGSILGLLVGGTVMLAIAWNIHFMENHVRKPGGIYAYAAETFGADHGFLCAWFLAFAYIAICWMDAAVLAFFIQHAWGFGSWFGIHYNIAGYEVGVGHIVLSSAALATACAICCRRRLSARVQTVMALLFCAGIAVCFMAVAAGHHGGLRTMGPAFAPGGGSAIFQVAALVAISPWLFVGFEAVAQSSDEFRFSRRKLFAVMAAAIATVVAAYILLTLLPALGPGVATGKGNWPDAVAFLASGEGRSVAENIPFETASRSFPIGKGGLMVTFLTFIAAIFTNLVGNSFAASRIVASLSDDAALPPWFGRRNSDGAPRNAILVIAVLSVFVLALGETLVGIVVDIAITSVCVTYAYVSAAAFKIARAKRNRETMATGLFGVGVSVALMLEFFLSDLASDDGRMSALTCFILVFWCVAGQLAFYLAFRRDRNHRFGRSPLVWNALFGVIILLSLMWVRKATNDTTRNALENVVAFHTSAHSGTGEVNGDDIRKVLQTDREAMNRSIMANNLVQAGITVLSLLISFALFSVMRRRERELEREKAKAKSFFFSSVSHDIRTPLNAIIGFSEILKAGPETEAEREQAVDAILVSGKTLLGLINDVLDLSKLESGKMQIVPEPTDCPRLLRELMDAFRVSGGKPGLELRCRVGDMPPLMLDPQRLRQIVFNLVGNAVKFTETGFIELRASYDRPRGAESGVFRLEVEDTGCGIAPENLKRLGAAYVQVGSKHSNSAGTGLGLAICRQLADAMGGELGMESTLGRGSTFWVTVPGIRIAPSPETEPAMATAPDAAQRKEVGGHPVRRILLVDDWQVNRMVFQALLKSLGDFQITMASDGREALDKLTAPGAAPFDIVFTDMWMPNMDGEGLVKAIRANPAIASLRVIVVTADVELRNKAAAMGFDGVLFKPITSAEVRKILNPAG